MTCGGRKDYFDNIRDSYTLADRRGKGRILDYEMRGNGQHRKALTRAVKAQPPPTPKGRVGRSRSYGPEPASALKSLWELSDRVCAKRLHPFPELLEVPERHGELLLEPEVKDQAQGNECGYQWPVAPSPPSTGIAKTIQHHQSGGAVQEDHPCSPLRPMGRALPRLPGNRPGSPLR